MSRPSWWLSIADSLRPESQGHRTTAEFCENGAKAVAEESTLRTVTPAFWAEHSIEELATKTEYRLGNQGRITHPVVDRPGDTHYSQISWNGAFELIGEQIRASVPDRTVFYTSDRTANEAAFLYQLFARSIGTNNLPDCSNMCQESSGSALNPAIALGKGTVSLEDIHHARVILVVGQNPGTKSWIHEDDLTELGFTDRDMVEVISTFQGEKRRADEFRLVVYPTPRGCAATYFPEANALMNRELVARESNTPGYKAMSVRFIRHETVSA